MKQNKNLEMIIGDIILVKSKNPFSRLIQIVTKSPYNHSLCYIGNEQCIESSWSGVRLTNINGVKNYDIYRHKTATKTELNMATDWMISQIGSKYDYLGLLGIGLAMIGKNKVNKLDDKNRYWCSELIADGYINAGINNNFNPQTWLTAPSIFTDKKYYNKI